MGFLSKITGGLFGGGGSSGSSTIPTQASEAQMEWQQKALDYLMGKEEIPGAMRDEAMNMWAGAMGLPGFDSVDLTQKAMQDPSYAAAMANIENMGVNAIDTMTNQAAVTGGIRGGDYQKGLGDVSVQQDLAKNQALADSYNRLIGNYQNMAGLPSNQNAIAQIMSNIGATEAQGMMGQLQTNLGQQQAGIGNLMGLGQLGMQAWGMFSDVRLKDDLEKISNTNHPAIKAYKWKWNEQANELGLYGYDEGYIVPEVAQVWPELLIVEDGYIKVDIDGLECNLDECVQSVTIEGEYDVLQ